MYKAVVFAALVAAANAGLLGAPVAYSGYAAPSVYSAGLATPALVSQQSNILRTPGNLGQVSTYSKTINTPYSSVSKSDVRVSNDALAYPSVYAAPAAYAAPIAKVAAPLAYAAPAAYASPLAYAAPRAYASPLAYAAAPVAKVATPIGVAYSAAPVVSHISFDGIGAHFAY